jgi:hypothetical protein
VAYRSSLPMPLERVVELAWHRYGLRIQAEDIRKVTPWLGIAYIDRPNNRALRWIRDYRSSFERIERGEAS